MNQQSVAKSAQVFQAYASDAELLAAARAWTIRRRRKQIAEAHKPRSCAGVILSTSWKCIFYGFANFAVLHYAIKMGWIESFSLGASIICIAALMLATRSALYGMKLLYRRFDEQDFLQSEEASAEKILPEFLEASFDESHEQLLGDSSALHCLKRNLLKRRTEVDTLAREVGVLLKAPQPENLRAELMAEQAELSQLSTRTNLSLQRIMTHITNLTACFYDRKSEVLSRVSAQFFLERSRRVRRQTETTLEPLDDTLVKSLRVFAGELGRIQNLSALCEPQRLFLDRDALTTDLDTFERVADAAFALEAPTAQARSC